MRFDYPLNYLYTQCFPHRQNLLHIQKKPRRGGNSGERDARAHITVRMEPLGDGSIFESLAWLMKPKQALPAPVGKPFLTAPFRMAVGILQPFFCFDDGCQTASNTPSKCLLAAS